MNELLEPFLHAIAHYPNKLVLDRINSRVLQPVLSSAGKTLAPTSPLRFVDFEALAGRFFEHATSKCGQNHVSF